uniref:Uncharacterized protein n=1 Tax=Sphaerodactylus townsendi TaxID=933632 RepID=A0ACB8F6Y8_9SAUR
MTKMKFEDFDMTEDGLGMNFVPKFITCKIEDPSSCEEHSSGTCTVQMNMENEENKIKMSPATEGCDQKVDSDQARRDHESMCQMANCKFAENIKSMEFPLLGNLGPLVNFKTTICKAKHPEMMVSAIMA